MTTTPDPHEHLHQIIDSQAGVTYTKGAFLGKGGFARCYEIIPTVGSRTDIYAVKIIQKSSLVKQRSRQKVLFEIMQLISEIRIHQSLSHRNIVRFENNFEDADNYYIVLELCSNGTLNELLKRKRRFSQPQLKFFLAQILEGVEYLHLAKVIHRDLKLGNIFLNDQQQVKIGDFGLATHIDFYGERKKTICGTPNYIAPEVLEGSGHSYEVDVWSLGVIFYTMAYGRPPFESKDVKETYRKIRSVEYIFPESVPTSIEFKQMVASMLQKEPHLRPSMKSLRGCEFLRESSLARQPSMSFRGTMTSSTHRDEKSQSDNGRLYSNNQLVVGEQFGSKDTTRLKSQDRFTERPLLSANKSGHCKSMQRIKSQKALKDYCDKLGRDSSQKILHTVSSRAGQQSENKLKIQSRHPMSAQKPLRDMSQSILRDTVSRNQLTATKPKRDEKGQETCIETISSTGLIGSMSAYATISVKRWVDYSTKYGIGYLMSNGCMGVYFNDSTKLINLSPHQYLYIERHDRQEATMKFTPQTQPPELNKKMSLFNHFRSYLECENAVPACGSSAVYVRRWYKAKHSVVFRLSNKSVQVIFVDQTEMLISSMSKMVYYTDRNREVMQEELSKISSSNCRELVKRFEYTKEILNEMASAHEKKTERVNGPS